MSLRQVLTIFNAERQLNDEETALLNILRKMGGAELESLAVALAPQTKSKPRKKREKKSAHAASLQQQIAGAGNKPKTNHEPEGILTEEEAQLVIGAIPLQMLPEDVK